MICGMSEKKKIASKKQHLHTNCENRSKKNAKKHPYATNRPVIEEIVIKYMLYLLMAFTTRKLEIIIVCMSMSICASRSMHLQHNMTFFSSTSFFCFILHSRRRIGLQESTLKHRMDMCVFRLYRFCCIGKFMLLPNAPIYEVHMSSGKKSHSKYRTKNKKAK